MSERAADPKSYVVVEITGSAEPGDEVDPSYDVFPASIEIYGDFRIVAEWKGERDRGGT